MAAIFGAIGLMAASAFAAEGERLTRAAWPIPAVAWRVPIGGCERGIPLGGFGAGNFMLNACGSFGPWHMRPGFPEPERRLAGAAFHFFEKPLGGPARLTTLTATPLMPGWPCLPPNSGYYHALYPKGWFTYRCFTADVSMKFFSPILKGNYKETSYPVAVFEFQVANPTDRPLDVGILFSFPNTTAHCAELRSGFANTPQEDKEHKIVAVVMDARSERNDPTAAGTQWCIAVRGEGEGQASFARSWNAMANGADLAREFATAGILPNDTLDGTHSAAAVAFRATLAPKATVRVPFALSWDFPRVGFGATLWKRRYVEYHNDPAGNAFPLAREALLKRADWEAAIDGWTRPILDEPAYPDWLKQAALNELYYDTFGGNFWESGCITEPRKFKGLHPESHDYFALACPTQPFCEPLAFRSGAARHFVALWPQIEHDVLIMYADAILDAPTASVWDLGSAAANPIFAYNAAPNMPSNARDLPALFILQVYAYYRATSDRAFLDYVWPAVKKCYASLRAADTYGYALARNDGDDAVASPCPLHGVSLLCGGLYVAALEALERMAAVRDDPEAPAIRGLIPLARTNLDRQLWREPLRYYGLDTHSRHNNALASGALLGLGFAQADDLPPILPIERVSSHLRQVFLRCVRPFRDYTGDGVGDVGAANLIGTDARPPAFGQAQEVSLGATYQVAAAMYHVGRATRDEGLMNNALRTAYGAYYQTWAVGPDKPLWAFNTPRAWRADNPARARDTQHIEPRAIWDLLLEIKNPYPEPAPKAPAKE